MKKYIYLIFVLLFANQVFAQKTINSASTTKFFVNEIEADMLVTKLIDPSNYISIAIGGVTQSDVSGDKMKKIPTSLNMTTKEDAKFLNLADFFTFYKVPAVNQNIIKVNGSLLKMRAGFLANQSRIAKIELAKDKMGNNYLNIITK